MSVKRRPVKKGGVKTLFANVSRKKKRHRAATSATAEDFEGDVPNLGIARALIVILAIHVVAIGGIFFHSHWLSDDAAESSSEPVAASSARPVQPATPPAALRSEDGAPLPTIRSGDSLYTVGTGDTYAGIADRFGVDELELRRANENIPIRQGRYLRIPPKMITAVEPPEVTQLREQPREITPAPAVAEPAPVVVEAPSAPVVEQPQMITTDAARRADSRGQSPSAAQAATSSQTRYEVKPGDTFWAIAQRNGTTVDKLMKANGIDNPRHLRVGAKLVIPE